MTKKKSHSSVSRRWPAHLLSRLRTLRDRVRASKADAMLITDAHDIRYLTGFPGEDAWMIVTMRTVVILSDHRFKEELDTLFAYARNVMRKGSQVDETVKVFKGQKIRKLAFQAEHLSVRAYDDLARKIGAKHLLPTGGWLLEQRAVKDDSELKQLRKAIDIQQRAFTKLLTQVRLGMTEKQLCAQLEFNMKSLGANDPSFPTIIGFGPNSSINHYSPGDVKLRKNQPILIDFGATYNAYHSDMTRTIVVGRFPKKIAEIYKIVAEAQQAGIEAIKPGAALSDIDAASRNVIRKAGYAKQFRHGLGHGIGLVIHEEPRLGEKAKGELKPGHVVTVEPGIYLPGVGGVRLEDDVLVTARGHRNLCSLPTSLESAMI